MKAERQQTAIDLPIKNRRHRKWPYSLADKRSDWCEVCGETDPHVLDLHHVSPKSHRLGKKFDATNSKITLCANCHAKCHRMYGGVGKNRPYVGPDTKEELIIVLRRERYRYRRINYHGGDLSGRVKKHQKRIVRDEIGNHGNGEISVDEICKKYNITGPEVRKLLKIRLKINKTQ